MKIEYVVRKANGDLIEVIDIVQFAFQEYAISPSPRSFEEWKIAFWRHRSRLFIWKEPYIGEERRHP